MKAYMSMLNLMQNNANFNSEGKLASLWFDQLILGADEKLFKKVIYDVSESEHWKDDTIKEFLKIQVSSQDILPDIMFLDESNLQDNECEASTEVLKEYYAKELELPESYVGAMHEVMMGGVGLASSVRYWILLNAKENCTFLPMDYERMVLHKLFCYNEDSKFGNFSNIISNMIPDVSEYSWDEIIELRQHTYWQQFRNKISDLNSENMDKKTLSELFNEIMFKDLAEMAQNMRPQIKKNVIKGIVSNIPLPIPINPVSVICTGKDIVKEIDFNKRYGWIYFYLDNKK